MVDLRRCHTQAQRENALFAPDALNAYSPNEGFRASISGDAGRIEYAEWLTDLHILTGSREIGQKQHQSQISLRVQKHFSDPVELDILPGEGNHGGGDALVQEQMFSANPPPDRLKRNAGHEQGAASLLIGAAANISIASGQPVMLDDLLALRPGATRLSELI